MISGHINSEGCECCGNTCNPGTSICPSAIQIYHGVNRCRLKVEIANRAVSRIITTKTLGADEANVWGTFARKKNLPWETPLVSKIDIDLAQIAVAISRIELGVAAPLFVEQQAIIGRVLQELTGDGVLPRGSPIVVLAKQRRFSVVIDLVKHADTSSLIVEEQIVVLTAAEVTSND